MDVNQLTVLVVDNSQERASELLRALQPEIQFAASDFTVSLRKAVLSHEEDKFEVCFVSGAFPVEDISSFITDMRNMKKDLTCLFVQVQDAVAEGFDRASVQAQGFATVISRKGTHQDKEALDHALKNRYHVQEVKKRKVNVADMMEMLLKEIDRTATDKRRGVERKMVAIPMDGIELDTQFDEEVLEGYFESLQKQTAESKPRTVEKLDVPQEVLERALPGLSKEGYKGASHRVWELLAQKYGVKIGAGPTAAEGDSDPNASKVSKSEPKPPDSETES